MPLVRTDRLARINLMIEEYRRVTQQRVLRRAAKLWRRAEARRLHLAQQDPPTRVH